MLRQMPGSEMREMRVFMLGAESRKRGAAGPTAVAAGTEKTRYDWASGKRGDLLMPEGSKSVQQAVQVTGDVLEKLYREGRLTGQALDDARRTDGDDIS